MADKPKILFVEDEEDLRTSMAEELVDAGYDVIEACDGQDGLEKALQHVPDLILSDITMPRLDGFGMLDAIRTQHPRLADVPVVFLSALADRKAVLQGVDRGADDYLTKPVDFDMMLAKVAANLRMSTRMIDRKQQEHLKLYNALSSQTGLNAAIAPCKNPQRIVVVGRGDAELHDVQSLLNQIGHTTHMFTSGAAFLKWIQDGRIQADIALIWFHTDDMQAPMIRKMAHHHCEKCVLVMPSDLSRTGTTLDPAGFSAALSLPTDAKTLNNMIDEVMDQAAGDDQNNVPAQASAG